MILSLQILQRETDGECVTIALHLILIDCILLWDGEMSEVLQADNNKTKICYEII